MKYIGYIFSQFYIPINIWDSLPFMYTHSRLYDILWRILNVPIDCYKVLYRLESTIREGRRFHRRPDH